MGRRKQVNAELNGIYKSKEGLYFKRVQVLESLHQLRAEDIMKSENVYLTVRKTVEKFYAVETEIDVKNVDKNKDGFNNDIIMFSLTLSNSEVKFTGDVVLKDFSVNQDDTNFTKEAEILRSTTIKKCINVPRLYFEDAEEKILIMEKVKGVTLDKIFLTQPEKAEGAIKRFGAELAKIHSVDHHVFEHYFTDTVSSQAKYYKTYITNLKNRLIYLEELQYLPILEAIAERFKAVEFNETFIHGDYHFWNVISTIEDRLFILDWEKASIADFRFDIAKTLILGYSWFGIDFKDTMLDGYCNISSNKLEHLDVFEALLSFDSFTKCVSLIQGGDDSHIRDRSFAWLKRRYELFLRHNGLRIKEAEDYLTSKGHTIEI